LRGSFSREVQVSCFQDTGIQPFVDHSPDNTIRDSLVKNFTQVGVPDSDSLSATLPLPSFGSHRAWFPTCVSTVTYFVRFRPRDPPVFVSASPDLAQRSWRNEGSLQARALGCRSPVVPAHFTWTPMGSLRYPGDPSCASAPLLDPGRTNVPLPWRSHRCCPRFEGERGLRTRGISGLTHAA
jgi:hypothetical protein